jgi:hypothetical protein
MCTGTSNTGARSAALLAAGSLAKSWASGALGSNEGGHRQGRIGLDQDLAGEAAGDGGFVECGLQAGDQVGGGAHDQARSGFDFMRQGFQRRGGWRLGQAGQGRAGDHLGRGQRELGAGGAVLVRQLRHPAQAGLYGLGDLRQGGGHRLLGADDRRLLALLEGAGADLLDLLGDEDAFDRRGGVGDAALAIELGVEAELAMSCRHAAALNRSARRRRRRRPA